MLQEICLSETGPYTRHDVEKVKEALVDIVAGNVAPSIYEDKSTISKIRSLRSEEINKLSSPSIKSEVEKKLASSTLAQRLWNEVIDFFFEEEITRRKNMIIAAIKDIQDSEEIFENMKPDLKSYDLEGNEIPAYSESQYELRSNLKIQIEKRQDALHKALKGDFTDLKEEHFWI